MKDPSHGSTEEYPQKKDDRSRGAMLLLRLADVGRCSHYSSARAQNESGDEGLALHCRASPPTLRRGEEYSRQHRCRLLVLQQPPPSAETATLARSSSSACATTNGGRQVADGRICPTASADIVPVSKKRVCFYRGWRRVFLRPVAISLLECGSTR